MSPRVRWSLGLLGLAVLLAYLGPVLGDPVGRAVGDPSLDLPAKLWTLWWSAQPARDTLVNHPTGGVDFFLLTPISGGLARLLPPVLAHNLATALAVVLALVGGGLWGHRWGGAAGSIVGAVGLATAPTLSSAVRDGTGEFTWVGLLALSLWAGERLLAARRRPSAQRVAATSGLLAATALSGWYLGAAAGLGLGLIAVAHAERLRALGRTALVGALALVLVLPAALHFGQSDLEPARLRAPSLVDHVLHGAPGPEPDAEAAAGPLLPRTQLVGPAGLTQPLWVVVLGIAAALAGRRREAWVLVPAAAVGLVLSLGSATPGGLPLPMLYLNRALSWLGRPLHLPFHLGALTTVALLGLAAAGLRDRDRTAIAAAALLLVGAVVPQGALPMDILEPPQSAVFAVPAPGALVELPTVWADTQAAADLEALHQLQHGQPVPRFPVFPTSLLRTEGLQQVRSTALLRALNDPARTVPDDPSAELRALGYRWLVLDSAAAPPLAARLAELLGAPEAHDGRFARFDLDPGSP